MKNINTGLIGHLTIALLAIVHWMNHAKGMTNTTLEIIMTTLGYTFNTTTLVLTVNDTNYTFYQLLEHACEVLYPQEETLREDIIKDALAIVYRLKYITADQKTALEELL